MTRPNSLDAASTDLEGISHTEREAALWAVRLRGPNLQLAELEMKKVATSIAHQAQSASSLAV